jgi:hypothetical protein
MIEEDLEWLNKQPRSLEREHVAEVLKDSITIWYDRKVPAAPLTQDVFVKNGFIGQEQGHYYEYSLSRGGNSISVRFQNHDIACSTPANRNEFALFGIIVLHTVLDLQMALQLCGITLNLQL